MNPYALNFWLRKKVYLYVHFTSFVETGSTQFKILPLGDKNVVYVRFGDDPVDLTTLSVCAP